MATGEFYGVQEGGVAGKAVHVFSTRRDRDTWVELASKMKTNNGYKIERRKCTTAEAKKLGYSSRGRFVGVRHYRLDD